MIWKRLNRKKGLPNQLMMMSFSLVEIKNETPKIFNLKICNCLSTAGSAKGERDIIKLLLHKHILYTITIVGPLSILLYRQEQQLLQVRKDSATSIGRIIILSRISVPHTSSIFDQPDSHRIRIMQALGEMTMMIRVIDIELTSIFTTTKRRLLTLNETVLYCQDQSL